MPKCIKQLIQIFLYLILTIFLLSKTKNFGTLIQKADINIHKKCPKPILILRTMERIHITIFSRISTHPSQHSHHN